MTRYGSVKIEGVDIFYREAGSPEKPALLLLHGFPSSSHMFRDLIPALEDRFHLIARLTTRGLAGPGSRRDPLSLIRLITSPISSGSLPM